MDRRLLVLVELVLALGVVTAGNEACDLDPVVLIQLLRCDSLALAVLEDGPLQQLRFVVRPVLLRIVRLLALNLRQLIENF